ncbi:MAG: class I SAM-dependent methyltransferase [Bacteroidetes bacterium]|nr:class I SAM-dependent methyltransferase [Bacteroidota bacterium]
MKAIKNTFRWLLNLIGLGGIVQLRANSILSHYGWFKSFQIKSSIDKNGNPIPWCTYPFIEFIEPRLSKEFNVLEFGSGNSTLWYSRKVAKIKCVEHDKSWYEKVKKELSGNIEIVYQELQYNGAYSREAKDQKYDIIIVDGRDRINCLFNSLQALKEGGVFVFDNSELKQYSGKIEEFCVLNNFKKIDFVGMSPISVHRTATSVLYRSNNCLNI